MFAIEDRSAVNTLLNGFLDMTFLMKVEEGTRFKYIAASDSALTYAGLTRDVFGKYMDEVLSKELFRDLYFSYKQAILSDSPQRFNTSIKQDGIVQVSETYLHQIRDDEGHCTHLLASVKDVTEQKNTELLLIGQKNILELIANGSELHEIFQAVTSSFEDVLPHSEVCIHLANEKDRRLEYAYSSKLPESFIQDIHQIEISPAEESCGRAAFTFQPVILKDIENDLKDKKKRKIALSHCVKACWSHPILSSSNQLLGILAVYFKEPAAPDSKEWRTMEAFTHLTALAIEQKQKEEALRKSEAKFRAMTENITDLIVTLDESGRVKYTSPSYRLIFGTEANLGNSFLTYTHPDDIPQVSDKFAKLLKEKKPLEVQLRYLHSDGHYVMLEARGMPVLKDSGEIENVVVIARDVTDRYKHQEMIKNMAYHDQLTGLPNRRSFSEEFEGHIKNAEVNNLKLGVLFLDLDRFKFINDSLGHSFGDLVLKEVSTRLKRFFRGNSRVFRMSGDEFTILIRDVNPIKLKEKITKLLSLLSEPIYVKDEMIHITASIGVSVYPSDGRDAKTLLKNADLAMYRAKENGKNTYHYYQIAMDNNSYERLLMENELHRAIEQDELILHYQPRFSIDLQSIVAVEALIRWKHPRWGMISPAEFIPLAEETGLITKIGAWVIQRSCQQLKSWLDKGFPTVKMAINLSARQFLQRDLVSSIENALNKDNIPSSVLELEITESTLMKYEETILHSIEHLKKMGIQFALDDFGTGYSSLGYLKKFHIDTLKIDQSFIRGIGTETDDSAIATAIITMAHALKMNVVAEGVETEEQYTYLKEKMCNEIQGFYTCRPMEAEKIEQLFLSLKEKRNHTEEIVS